MLDVRQGQGWHAIRQIYNNSIIRHYHQQTDLSLPGGAHHMLLQSIVFTIAKTFFYPYQLALRLT